MVSTRLLLLTTSTTCLLLNAASAFVFTDAIVDLSLGAMVRWKQNFRVHQ